MTEALDPKVAEFAANWMQGSMKALRIDGFGPEDPPPPAWGPPLQVQEIPHPDLPRDPALDGEDPEPAVPPSPLLAPIPRPQTNLTAPILQTPALGLGLVVQDRLGSFQGQAVELSESEQASIARIVLEAVQKRLRGQLDAIRKQAPKRAKRVRRGDMVVGPDPPAFVQAPKKKRRGRPKGSKNKPKSKE